MLDTADNLEMKKRYPYPREISKMEILDKEVGHNDAVIVPTIYENEGTKQK